MKIRPTKSFFAVDLPVLRETNLGTTIRTPEETVLQLPELATLAQEALMVLTLSIKYKTIGKHLITLGLVDASLVHPREVFRPAITDGASMIVLAHNHPSGDPAPSAEDIRMTRTLVAAGKIIGIPVVDHVIIGRPEYAGARSFVSLREAGLVDFSGGSTT